MSGTFTVERRRQLVRGHRAVGDPRQGGTVVDGAASPPPRAGCDKLYPWRPRSTSPAWRPATYTFVALTDDPSGGARAPARPRTPRRSSSRSDGVRQTRASSTAPCCIASTCSSGRRRRRARDGPAPGRAAGPGEPAAVPLARRAARRLRPVRRHPRARGPVAGAAADDARHHPPAHRRGRAVLRPWTQPVQERERKVSQNIRPALRPRPRRVRRRALRRRWRDGPLPHEGARRGAGRARSRTYPATALGQLARLDRRWSRCRRAAPGSGSGGVVYEYVDRWLGRPSRAGRAGDRAPLPARVRAGLRRRRHRLVRRDPAGRRAQGHGRPGASTRTRTARCCTTCPTASSPTRTPRRRCGCSAPTTTSGSPTPAATGSPIPRSADGWMGANGGVAMHALRRRLARGAVAGRRTAGSRSSSMLRQAHQGRAVRARRGDRTGSSDAARPLTPSGSAGQPQRGVRRQQRGDGGDAGGRGAQHLGAEPHGERAGGDEARRPRRR